MFDRATLAVAGMGLRLHGLAVKAIAYLFQSPHVATQTRRNQRVSQLLKLLRRTPALMAALDGALDCIAPKLLRFEWGGAFRSSQSEHLNC